MSMLRPSILALALAVAGCSSMKVRTEYDPAAPYATYKNYAWITPAPGPEQAPTIRNPAVQAAVVAALDREMGKKGLVRTTLDANPDFLVSVHGWAQSRIEVTNYGYSYGGVYSYGPYRTAGPVPISEAREYTDGTLLLDFVDAKTKKLVWRGTATDTLTSPDRVWAVVDAAARELLAAYPPKN